MGNSILAWTNYAKAASIVALSSATNMSPVNVANDSGSPASGWQTAYGVTTLATGAMLTVTPLQSQNSWDVCGIFRSNLTSAASINVTLWDTNGTQKFTTTVSGPVAGYGQVVIVFPPNTVADYVQIYFNDSANPDGFINIPLLFCGACWYPIGSAGFSSSVGRDVTIAEATSRGGSEFPTLYFQRRRYNIALDAMRTDETWQHADPLNQYSASGSNVLFIPDNTSAYLQQEAVFGRLKSTADVSYPYGGADRRRWAASVTERL